MMADWEDFGRRILERFCEGDSVIDMIDVQEWGEATGVLIQKPGRFNPKTDIDLTGASDAGDPPYMVAPLKRKKGSDMSDAEIKFTTGGKLGLALGAMCGVFLGVFGPLFIVWETGKAAGETIVLHDVEHNVGICKTMLESGPLNDIQRGYCAELLAKALGEIDRETLAGKAND